MTARLQLRRDALVSLHLLDASDAGVSLSVLIEDGGAVFIFEARGLVRLEPLLADAVL